MMRSSNRESRGWIARLLPLNGRTTAVSASMPLHRQSIPAHGTSLKNRSRRDVIRVGRHRAEPSSDSH